MLIFYKSIDQSVLNAGFTIPVIHQEQMYLQMGLHLSRGEKRKIRVIIGASEYDALMTNIQFDESKYPNHKDLLQIRYGKNSPLSQALKTIFSYTGNMIADAIKINGNGRLVGLSEDKKEFLAVYTTNTPGTLLFECIPNVELTEEGLEIASLGELRAEGILDGTDDSAEIILKTKVCKIRRLTRTISNDLKEAYGYRCQICGEYIGKPYGSRLIHAHHIDYFTRSLNNNASNIMIVCPNHHGIIHDQNPVFDFKEKVFRYPNGYVEGLKLNYHL